MLAVREKLKQEYIRLIIDRQIKRRKEIKKAQGSLWHFCKLLHPDFYTESKKHLKKLCKVLQALREGTLKDATGKIYKKLIIEMPPRHGKTRTLVLFCSWLVGRDSQYKIITASYNDDLATDFSKYTRNTILEEKNVASQVVYSDIFPGSKIHRGDASYHQWALEGSFFTFKSTGKGGTVTGKGSELLLIDDLVKSSEEAFNENQLNKDWAWYTGTWLSRQEKGAIQIINQTPWSKNDVPGRIKAGEEAADWYVLSMPAFDGEKMLCPDILDKDGYKNLQRIMDPLIFEANYNCKRIDAKGSLYGTDFKTYAHIPLDSKGRPLVGDLIMFADTADKGQDYFAAIFCNLISGLFFIIDVIYTRDSVEVTEPLVAEKLLQHKIKIARFESNSGGRAIAVHTKNILEDKLKWYGTTFDTFTQSANKEARILSNMMQVKDRIIFPQAWANLWPEFYRDVVGYQREGKNKNDDGPDVLTQAVEYLQDGSEGNYFFKRR